MIWLLVECEILVEPAVSVGKLPIQAQGRWVRDSYIVTSSESG
jgi:hypothetical protein